MYLKRFMKLGFYFNKINQHVSNHTLKIIESNPLKYQTCKEYMQKILSQQVKSDSEIIRKKLNLCFSVSNTDDYISPYKKYLYELIEINKITNQSDLDRILRWLNKQLKQNNKITYQQIQARIKQSDNLHQSLIKTLEQIKSQKGKQIDISSLSKQMRDLYPAIHSQIIYDQIKKRFQNTTVKPNHQIWDKLSQLKPRLLACQLNSPQIYQEHKKITQNKLRFRFPPEPNGYLHIGHCKSIRINFETAKKTGGICFLRFDDTNPASQSHQFIEKIIDDVKWMGYEPYKITYASDYFSQLQEFAIKLIKQGKAYVCESSREQMFQERKNKLSNKYREKPIEFSLQNFPNLQLNQTLRLKLDPAASNPTLRDPVIYRRKSQPHPRTGTKYQIYPTYDYTHCICDSLEHIDYSLCSLEFQIRRELYYTILDLLKLYKPIVWQYSRLNIQGNVLSKRKITKIVQKKQVENWSDPRLLTIEGLKNRGFTPSMIISFIDKINSSRSGNQNIIQYNLLDLELKKQLYKTSERVMAVLNPIKLIILNYTQNKEITVPLYPQNLEKGYRTIRVNKIVYIQKDNKFQIDSAINLKYLGRINIKKITNDQIEAILSQRVQSDKKMKNIHWIADEQSQTMQIVQFNNNLFKKSQNSQNETILEFNQQNEIRYPNSKVPKNLQKYKIYQFERLGYYKFYNGKIICCTRL